VSPPLKNLLLSDQETIKKSRLFHLHKITDRWSQSNHLQEIVDSSSPWNHLRKSRFASLRSNFADPLLEFADHNQLLRWSAALFSSDYYMSECLKLITQLKSPLLNKQSIEKLLLRSTETTRISPLSKHATISDQQRQHDWLSASKLTAASMHNTTRGSSSRLFSR
jgi:hypothetical protein